jgi:hypothetical protein
MKIMKKGTVIESRGKPKPHDFTIEDGEGNHYFVHLGDIKANEEILYHLDQTTYLKVGEEVEFALFDKENKAINVVLLPK